MSHNQIYQHYVFAPKKRQGIITPDRERELFAYIMGITENLNAKLIRINAAYNHIHMLVRMPTTITTADFVATVKRSTSVYIKQTDMFPKFWGWAREYFVESVSPGDVDRVKAYIANQKEHHKIVSFEDEWYANLDAAQRAAWKWTFLDE